MLGEWQKYSTDSAPPTQSDRLLGQMEAGGAQYFCQLSRHQRQANSHEARMSLTPHCCMLLAVCHHHVSMSRLMFCRCFAQQCIFQLPECGAQRHEQRRRNHRWRCLICHLLVRPSGLPECIISWSMTSRYVSTCVGPPPMGSSAHYLACSALRHLYTLMVTDCVLCSMPSAAQFTYFAVFMGSGVFFVFIAVTMFLPVIILVSIFFVCTRVHCRLFLSDGKNVWQLRRNREATSSCAGASKVCLGLHAGVIPHNGQLLRPQRLPGAA